MSQTAELTEGGLHYAFGVLQYPCGVAALLGRCIRKIRFRRLVRLSDGFRQTATIVQGLGRPQTAFCACELCSSAPFAEDGRRAFNAGHQQTLSDLDLIRDSRNLLVRSSVCPELVMPAEPGCHRFSFTMAESVQGPSFAVAGSGKAEEGYANHRDHIVAPGDLSLDGMRARVGFVFGEMRRRLGLLGLGREDMTAAQVYAVHDIPPFLKTEIAGSGATGADMPWQHCGPPVMEIQDGLSRSRVRDGGRRSLT